MARRSAVVTLSGCTIESVTRSRAACQCAFRGTLPGPWRERRRQWALLYRAIDALKYEEQAVKDALIAELEVKLLERKAPAAGAKGG